MTHSIDAQGFADADLVTSGGRGHLVQYDSSSSYRLDLVTTNDSDAVVGMLTNNDASAAGDSALFTFAGWVTGKAGAAIQPLQEVVALTDSEFGPYTPGSGAVVVGRYIPEAAYNGTDLAAADAGEDVRIYLYARKEVRGNDAGGVLKAVYDFAVDGGAISAIGLGTFLPDNAIVAQSIIDVITTFTSATDAATVAISSTDVTVDAAIAISDAGNPWDAGIREGDHQYDTGGTWEKTTSRQELNLTIAVEAVTAGKLVVFLDYKLSE